jgi:formylglycine-generating enzyme required for sulfatase activity
MKPWFSDEHPAHRVKLPLYFIDKYETTNAEYRTFAQNTGRKPPPDWNGGQTPDGKARHPVIHVTWEDANAYCLWAGKRLPTETEWEKAARGPDGLRYPWGNEFDETRANVNGQVGNISEIGHYEKGRSPYGSYDMTGNVWEWTADWYQPYPGNTYTSDKFGEKLKVLRGNSWAGLGHFPPKIHNEVKAHYSRAGYRLFMSPTGIVNDVGFRCAKSAP